MAAVAKAGVVAMEAAATAAAARVGVAAVASTGTLAEGFAAAFAVALALAAALAIAALADAYAAAPIAFLAAEAHAYAVLASAVLAFAVLAYAVLAFAVLVFVALHASARSPPAVSGFAQLAQSSSIAVLVWVLLPLMDFDLAHLLQHPYPFLLRFLPPYDQWHPCMALEQIISLSYKKSHNPCNHAK